MIRSIRFSLTLLYAGILTATLCLFGYVLYTNVTFNLRRDIDELLKTQADGVGEAVFSFLKAEWEPKSNLESAITRWAQETDELKTARPIRLLLPDGRPLVFSASFGEWGIPASSQAVQKAQSRKTYYETFRFMDHRVRLITRPFSQGGRVLLLVQVATSLHQADASLKRLKAWLFTLIPATILGTSLMGWFLASVALKPIGRMITQAQQIGESRLHERLDVPPTQDELSRLARTFNEMLARLERGFRRLRQFSAAASHELRTPLTVMKGEIEWVLRRPRAEGESERVFRTQLAVINEMADIVGQLLAVAKAEGDAVLESEPVNLNELIRHAQKDYGKIIEDKKIRINVSEDGSGERKCCWSAWWPICWTMRSNIPLPGEKFFSKSKGRTSSFKY